MVMSSVTELPLQTQSSRLPSALAAKDTKQTTEGPRTCACLRVSFCTPALRLMGKRGEERDGRVLLAKGTVRV